MQRKQEAEISVPEVTLFMKYNFHKSCLVPIYSELSKKEIMVDLTSKRHSVYDKFELSKKKYPIFVIADEWGSLFRDCSETLITTGHSPANKNTTFNNKNKYMDYVYVPSQYYKNELIKRGSIPKKEIVVTGYPAASRIFRKEYNQSSVFCKFIKTDASLNVLFAPTYNRDLSIMDALIAGERNYQLFSKMTDMNIVFKLHPVLPKKYPEHHNFVKDLSVKYPNIYYHEDSHDDISDAIIWSDIVVGDCSGALLLAACHGPVIAYENPTRSRSEYFDETGPEWKFREDFAYRITEKTLGGLPDFIREFSVEKLDYKFGRRSSIVDLLFAHQRYAEEKCADKIIEILESK